MIEGLIEVKHLLPYFELATEVAKQSSCKRRHYGAVIAANDFFIASSANTRVSKCCDGMCSRARFKIGHGQRVEVGGEIHAEVGALLAAGGMRSDGTHFVLVGYDAATGNELYGSATYPCHSCAVAIKFAGYKHIYIRHDKDNIIPVSVGAILEFREQEWEGEN